MLTLSMSLKYYFWEKIVCQVGIIQLVKEEIKMSEKLNMRVVVVFSFFFFLFKVENVKPPTIGRASKQAL